MKLAVHFPPLYHVQIVGAVTLLLSRVNVRDHKSSKSLRRLQMEHFHSSLRRMQEEIRSPMFHPTEAHLQTTVTLARHTKALHDIGPSNATSLEPYPISPLAWLQNYYSFTSLEPVESHVKGVYDMVEMRGGLKTVKRPMLDILQL
jgi:hypothetical protein